VEAKMLMVALAQLSQLLYLFQWVHHLVKSTKSYFLYQTVNYSEIVQFSHLKVKFPARRKSKKLATALGVTLGFLLLTALLLGIIYWRKETRRRRFMQKINGQYTVVQNINLYKFSCKT